jgi:hypothetical protein
MTGTNFLAWPECNHEDWATPGYTGGILPGESAMERHQPSDEPEAALTAIFWGLYTARALHTVAELCVADVLKDGPQTIATVAERVGAQVAPLSRVLRTLAAAGVFTEVPPDRYALTSMGELLRSDVPGSLRGYIVLYGTELFLQAAHELGASVRTGKAGAELAFGVPLYGYLADHPDEARVFDLGMMSVSSMDDAAVLAAYDFSGMKLVVDLGGGQGSLLAAILTAYPSARGILFERTAVLDGAAEQLAGSGVRDRCQLVDGNFFDAVPAGADAYLLKRVLHNWDDDHVVAILRACRRAIPVHGRLLSIDAVVPPGDEPSPTKLLDLVMLSLSAGGKERTEAELRALFAEAGFTLVRVIPAGWLQSIAEGVPKP